MLVTLMIPHAKVIELPEEVGEGRRCHRLFRAAEAKP